QLLDGSAEYPQVRWARPVEPSCLRSDCRRDQHLRTADQRHRGALCGVFVLHCGEGRGVRARDAPHAVYRHSTELRMTMIQEWLDPRSSSRTARYAGARRREHLLAATLLIVAASLSACAGGGSTVAIGEGMTLSAGEVGNPTVAV